MFSKILIANRGEIACRVIKTARRLGIKTVAVYSDADRTALHVKMADEAIFIGPAAASNSYLCADKIIAAAIKTGAEAIHPGYGFLSENPDFCRACADAKLVFIGPPAKAIEAMGSKSAAKTIISKTSVPLLPGYHGDNQRAGTLKQAASDISYPILLKASAGGGGKGMRIVQHAQDFDDALAATKREAKNAFGDDKILVEKYLTGPRHVEIQIFCDNHGNSVYLFERDCSLQRRHQKIIEEAPAPGVSEATREAMGKAAIYAAEAIAYRGAGTVEFLLTEGGDFYFMEMNTRLQVEHPITEMITGIDLVEWQLIVATGGPLPQRQADLKINGHAFEARLYAEDTDHNFLPQTGRLNCLKFPEESRHIRVDSGVQSGDSISMYYDPMIAKLIAWDESREAALHRLYSALAETCVAGLVTNTQFLKHLCKNTDFSEKNFDTGFIDQHLEALQEQSAAERKQAIALAIPIATLIQLLLEQSQPNTRTPRQSDGWRLNLQYQRIIKLYIDQQEYSVLITAPKYDCWQLSWEDKSMVISGRFQDERITATIDGHSRSFPYHIQAECSTIFTPHGPATVHAYRYSTESAEHHGGFLAPMNGRIISAMPIGSEVKKGNNLIIMEAMKMEHSITAPADGRVLDLHVREGDLVEGGTALLEFQIEGKQL